MRSGGAFVREQSKIKFSILFLCSDVNVLEILPRYLGSLRGDEMVHQRCTDKRSAKHKM